jgi:secreted trypsin-like serine protease
MKIIPFAYTILLCISVDSCGKFVSSNSHTSYSGPSQCLAKNSTNLTENIVGGNIVDSMTIPSGKNTVAILLNSNNGNKILCSGTVVADNLILTAGHCFDSINSNSTSPGTVVFSDDYNNTSNALAISCWQRPSGYVPCSVNNTYSCSLNDIAWVKVNGSASSLGYHTVSILSNPQTILTTESKWMLGFGLLNDNQKNTSGLKYIVKSASSSSYPDTLPPGAANTFDYYTFDNAYEQFLTVIGPNNQTNPGKGTCEGDSGGPVYVNRSGNYVLAALTQGSNSLLSPHPTNQGPHYSFDNSNYASCNDGYGVYTTVGNYVNWITSTSGISLSIY